MSYVFASPASDKEPTSTPGPYPAGLELAEHQPPPPNWAGNAADSTPLDEKRRVCGLRRTTFILVIALIIVIIAAAVGGGVGGSLAVQNAKNNAASCLSDDAAASVSTVTLIATATATRTGTSTASGLTVPTGVLALDCPGLDNRDQVITLGDNSWTFTPSCGTDYWGSDFGAVIVYSFHDCLQACAAHNHFSGEDQCMAVTFSANQTAKIPTNYGNCWLKSDSGEENDGTDNTVAGAVLRTSR
ncbi:hypothetical protein F5X99DRAFT_368776 [Biscogniauxia marginata]|nr:hypothetical protein F5X99DRAFT_368776 [Biscogniauxia marginata]